MKTIQIHTALTLWKAFVLTMFGLVAFALPDSTTAATITVQNKTDSGPGSLRQAIADANSGDTIDFAPAVTGTITTSGLSILKTLTIIGPGAANLTISGNNTNQVFQTGSLPPQASTHVTISKLTIAKGNSPESFGGGINNYQQLTVSDCVFTECSATYGGGLLSQGGPVTLLRCTFTGNNAEFGGAIGCAYQTVTAIDCTIRSNTASLNGGGIANGGGGFGVGGSMELKNCTIADNTVTDGMGGGLYSFDYSYLTVSNCTFYNNQALATPNPTGFGKGTGGGMHSQGNLTMRSCTIAGNTAAYEGGGLRCFPGDRSVSIGNTIIAGNSVGTSGSGPDCAPYFPSADYNLIQNTSGCTITGTTTHNITGQDPKLAALANNGGPTQTLALLPGSPAIDHGDNSVLSPPLNLTTDQRGVARKIGPTVDIGAFEFTLRVDFNADNKPDYLLLKAATGGTAFWYMNGPSYVSFAFGPTLPAGWAIVGVADFNGDGKPDFLLSKASTGGTAIWYMNGPSYVSFAFGPTLPAGWAIAGVADFNGDGQPDFLLSKASTGTTAVWFMNGPSYVSFAFGPTLPAGWLIEGVADFNGDGQPDFLLSKASTGATAVWYMNGPSYVSFAFGPTLPAGWSVSGVEDFNGDGKPDFLLYKASTGGTSVWYMNGPSYVSFAYGPTLPTGWALIAP